MPFDEFTRLQLAGDIIAGAGSRDAEATVAERLQAWLGTGSCGRR
ncbi:MAG: hypothetical protein U0992_00415 [Planctomycetaceae bacterium]